MTTPAMRSAAGPATADFVRRHLPVVEIRSVPEIRLHQAGPQSGLGRRLAGQGGRAPYWAYCWGGGLALARHVLDHPAAVAGQSLLDLGAGSGLVGIAAAMAGAGPVQAADVDPQALVAIGLNAALNGVSITAWAGDALAADPPAVDMVAVGDLFYEAGLARRVLHYLDRCLERGARVLVGDPGRRHLPRRRLRHLADYSVSEYGREQPASVFTLLGA